MVQPTPKVSVLVPVVEAGANKAVTPAGKPDAVRETLPVNPPVSVTPTVTVPDPHCGMVMDAGETLSVYPVEGVTVTGIVMVFTIVPDVPVTVRL